jgi:hypothetical protein
MVLVSHIYKFIYVKNGKVGGTSTEGFFEKYCSNPNTDYKLTQVVDEKVSEYGIIGARLQGKYIILQMIENVYINETHPEYQNLIIINV